MAGRSMNSPASRYEVSRDWTSCSRMASPAHAFRRNASRRSDGTASADCNKSSTCFQRSGSIAMAVLHFVVKPSSSGTPVAHHGDGRDFQHFCGFFHAQSAKKAQFHDLRLARVHLGQSLERDVERHKVAGLIAAYDRRIVDGHMLNVPATLKVVPSRVVH